MPSALYKNQANRKDAVKGSYFAVLRDESRISDAQARERYHTMGKSWTSKTRQPAAPLSAATQCAFARAVQALQGEGMVRDVEHYTRLVR